MSERFQKTFISAREFVESWDKEIYELTNLDFFIYLMINHLGNQLEKRYFVRDRRNSPLNLGFESIGTLCFNLGDGFEYFLEDNCFNNCSLNCLLDLDTLVSIEDYDDDELTRKRLTVIQAFLSEQMVKEQCLRVELMNHVILDTLIHFYSEELGVEINEDNTEIVELADFIENVMVEFIRQEGQSLLQRPFDPAMDYFEELLEQEEDYDQEPQWSDDVDSWQVEEPFENWQSSYEDVEIILDRFVNDYHYNPPETVAAVSADIELFKEFLIDYADVHDVFEINEEHLLEFLSYWLVRHFVFEDEKQIPQIFRTMARFITWLYHNYDIDYKKTFLTYYERVKTEVPRVVQALNAYLNEYDLLEALLSRGKSDTQQISGFYEVRELHSRIDKTLDIVDVHYYNKLGNVHLNSSAYLKLKKGDIIQATLIKRGTRWEVLEIHYIFPQAAKPFLH